MLHLRRARERMSELKTMKEIRLDKITQFPNDIRNKLKAEAVKWVKDIRNSTLSTSQKKEDIRCFTESFIKHFFNLTEKDLEGEE